MMLLLESVSAANLLRINPGTGIVLGKTSWLSPYQKVMLVSVLAWSWT